MQIKKFFSKNSIYRFCFLTIGILSVIFNDTASEKN